MDRHLKYFEPSHTTHIHGTYKLRDRGSDQMAMSRNEKAWTDAKESSSGG